MNKNLDYGVVGNCKSAALISKTASVDWLCLPQFDSASVFANILDEQIGGSFEILVDENYAIEQHYSQNTAVLITTFSHGEHCFEVHDFMPRYKKKHNRYHHPPELIRVFKHISGEPAFSILFNPKLEYAQGETSTTDHGEYILSETTSDRFDNLFLYTNCSHSEILNRNEVTLTEDVFFLLSYNEKIFAPDRQFVQKELKRTHTYWLEWVENLPRFDQYNNEIVRSAITLKLLSFQDTGAILAAITTSLPETIGEVRNWDYRFCWIRDASMVVKVMSEMNQRKMTRNYLRFIVNLFPDKDEKLQVMYGINGQKVLTEKILHHLNGYEGSKPVRIGNAAYYQQQNDIYGILMDVIFQRLTKYRNDTENAEELWTITKNIVHVVQKHWREPDKGIWELRHEDKHFTFSKVLCWVAIDRAVKVADILGKEKQVQTWKELEEKIKKNIFNNAWNEQVQSFTQSYESSDLDASVLLMEGYGFIEAKHPKFKSTVKAIGKELSNDGLLYRYKNKDDFGLPSSSFTICTFWYINSLYNIGEEQEAKQLFNQLLTYSNHLGLFSEDIDFKTKRLLGNFPQAYSHLALIETATNLCNVMEEETVLNKLEYQQKLLEEGKDLYR